MFYKMFEDSNSVRPQLSEFDALAVIDWERALLSSRRSFHQLYREVFAPAAQGEMDFWVKGGSDVIEPADGGAVIYNNNDPAFVAFLARTRELRRLEKPHGVAMWRTLSDFQDERSLFDKFVSSNLVSVCERSFVGCPVVDRRDTPNLCRENNTGRCRLSPPLLTDTANNRHKMMGAFIRKATSTPTSDALIDECFR